ncbi:hypothetical protein AB0B31_36500 [Catellatospora citrea]|uniref:hypothetical protein n=1 Tax=Catellatospora citrea TaxID=53366 RepID=UPI0033C33CC4
MALSPEGERQAAFCVGDAIDVLVTDRGGAIWTAYGDEGIYGDHPQSAAGLAGWSERGQVVWTPSGRLPEWPLAGCAAATEDDGVWLAWYSSGRSDGTFGTAVANDLIKVRSGGHRLILAVGEDKSECGGLPEDEVANPAQPVARVRRAAT